MFLLNCATHGTHSADSSAPLCVVHPDSYPKVGLSPGFRKRPATQICVNPTPFTRSDSGNCVDPVDHAYQKNEPEDRIVVRRRVCHPAACSSAIGANPQGISSNACRSA